MTFVKGFPLIRLVASMCSHGAVQPDRTRIIFNSKDKATSLRVENRSDKLPYLAYSWIENEKGEKSDEFLVALPPIQRLEPKATSQVRIMKQAATAKLPTDRESLFYYNLREIPPVPEGSESPSKVALSYSGDPPHYAKKWAIMLSNSYRLASRITSLP